MELDGEEARDCDWAQKGTTVRKVLMRRVVGAWVEDYLGRKRGLGQKWPLISLKDPEALSICHGPGYLPGTPMIEQGLGDCYSQRFIEGCLGSRHGALYFLYGEDCTIQGKLVLRL